MTSNIVESINSATRHARELPVTDSLDYMTNLVHKRNYNNGAAANYAKTTLSNKYEDVLTVNIKASQTISIRYILKSYSSVKKLVVPSTQFVHSVIHGRMKHIVSLQQKTCTCHMFQVDELPCPHAMAVRIKFYFEKYQYCSPYYTRDFLIKTYEMPVHPLSNQSMCDIPQHVCTCTVLPPNARIRPGRPKKKRTKGGVEAYFSTQVTCGHCGHKGHNQKTCKNIPIKD
ncbi:uncharacterized protein LOC132639736 [Lycium barbarum]|uniref:uncharacterized protein LOC132639736 n=1 Tax=Lycium barbarum TaxID=112863 RepID=UPI00293EB75B|nr:uncharacterized protein LOC132639736 [Lycium barbarum]